MPSDSEMSKNYRIFLKRQKHRVRAAVRMSIALVKTESQKRTPVDEGNLKASHYTAMQSTGSKISGQVGCTAEYAVYVHENLEARHTIGQAKFLENAFDAKEEEIGLIFARRLKV